MHGKRPPPHRVVQPGMKGRVEILPPIGVRMTCGVGDLLPIKSSRSAVRYVSTAGDASGPRLWVSLAGIRSGYPGRFCPERSLQVPLGGGAI